MPTATLIANPVAGSDAALDRLGHLERECGRGVSLTVVVTGGPDDAREAAVAAARRGDRQVFVAGGDGTLNEVINGLAVVPGALATTRIGVIPLGTGNDFAAALGLPSDFTEAVAVAVHGTPRRVDVGQVNGRRFVNVSAGGFIADVSEAVDPGLKSVAGRLAYLLGGASVLLAHEAFVCESERFTGACLLFAVCNAPLIGGGRPIAPAARIDDGAFDVCIVEDIELIDFLGVLRRVADGSHLDHPAVHGFRTSSLALTFDREIAVNADGEPFRARRCAYTIEPAAACFVAPSP
jgi:diacylglycerol kinase (ATP)